VHSERACDLLEGTQLHSELELELRGIDALGLRHEHSLAQQLACPGLMVN
jgi:hypothetical protein